MNVDIEQLRENFTLFESSLPEILGNLFEQLEAEYPDCYALFSHITDFPELKNSLGHGLGLILKNAHDPDTFSIFLNQLGQRHGQYGANAQHFIPFISCLVQSIEKQLGETSNEHIIAQWLELFCAASALMIKGMREVEIMNAA